jgi:hypothetical protein
MGKLQKVQMRVSIANPDWSYQPDEVVMLEMDLAEKWIRAGHAVAVNGNMPLTSFDLRDGLADLDAAQALRYRCTHCDRRTSYVLRNRALCAQHFRSEMEA